MAIPQGAYRANYSIHMFQATGGTEVGIDISFSVDLYNGTSTENINAAAAIQAGAEAMVSSIEDSYPLADVTASRSYECRLPGDPWPVP
jgi:hypothetical protein